MDNIAYLHLACAYESGEPSKLLSLSPLLNPGSVPNWKRLSGEAWKYMLPLALTLSILGAVSNVLALERGDQGPSVRHLQQHLKSSGFYHAPITQVYDYSTENAVRHFQKAAGLPVSGIANSSTLEKLSTWSGNKVHTTSSLAEKTGHLTRHSGLIVKGEEGENVRVLQERLRVAGFYYGNATGIFGPITEEAVKRFQTAYKLDVDGVVGPATSAKLPPVGVGDGEDTTNRLANSDVFSIGDRGEPVRVLQEHLVKAGYLSGEPNGYYGPYTKDAVTRFQVAHHLRATGMADPTTRKRLYKLVKASPKSEFSVLEIQRRLQQRGFYKGPLNGMMAPDTRKAIKQAQEFYGVSLSDIRTGDF